MLRKLTIYSLILFAISIFIASCELIDRPIFSDTPKISFKDIKKITNFDDPILGNKGDQVVVSIKFQDGDGDLGLSDTDKENDPRFKLNNENGKPNPYHFNYFVKVFRKRNTDFQEVIFNPSLTGAFRPLNTTAKTGPIEGTLDRSIFFPYALHPFENDTLKFEIQLVDKALHASNVIATTEVIINQK